MDGFGGPVFHASKEHIDEFMKAPAIHVGTYKSAHDRGRAGMGLTGGEVMPRINKLQFSEHVEIHPTVFSDAAANTAHAALLANNGMAIPSVVYSSGASHAISSGRAIPNDALEAYEALKNNKIIAYANEGEDYGSTSYVVPSPAINLRRPGRRDPSPQPRLPMDYSGTGTPGVIGAASSALARASRAARRAARVGAAGGFATSTVTHMGDVPILWGVHDGPSMTEHMKGQANALAMHAWKNGEPEGSRFTEQEHKVLFPEPVEKPMSRKVKQRRLAMRRANQLTLDL